VVHILPEAYESLQNYNNGKDSYPWPFFAAVCSYSIVLRIDKVLFTNHAHEIVDNHEKSVIAEENNFVHNVNDDFVENDAKTIAKTHKEEENEKIDFTENILKGMVSQKVNLVLTASQMKANDIRASFMSAHRSNKEHESIFNPNSPLKGSIHSKKTKPRCKTSKSVYSKENDHLRNSLLPEVDIFLAKENDKGIERKKVQIDEETIVEEIAVPIIPKKTFNFTPYLLAIAMGIHAAFAGLALGITKNTGGFIGMLLAILCHKWAEALTIGISFSKH